jgi:hypothetical protein
VCVAAALGALAHHCDQTARVTNSDAPGGYGTEFKIEGIKQEYTQLQLSIASSEAGIAPALGIQTWDLDRGAVAVAPGTAPDRRLDQPRRSFRNGDSIVVRGVRDI